MSNQLENISDRTVEPKQIGWYLVKWGPNDIWQTVYICYISNDGLSWGFAPNDDPEFITRQKLSENQTAWNIATNEQAEAAQKFFDQCYS